MPNHSRFSFWDDKNDNFSPISRFHEIDELFVQHVSVHNEAWSTFLLAKKVETLKELNY